MKRLSAPSGGLKCALLCILLGLLVAQPATADPVDAELILLVDITSSVSDGEFALYMESAARSFESAGVVDAIQAGTMGNLAVSLVFYTGRNRQVVGVDWMEISDANSAASFAQALRNVSRPLDQPRTGIAAAIDYSVPRFGDETGAPANGFESAQQALFLIGDGPDNHAQTSGGTTREEAVQASRDAALASGVDVIGAMTVGAPDTVDQYFTDNVIGGQVGGIPGAVTNAETASDLFSLMDPTLVSFVDTLSPEPHWFVLMPTGLLFLFARRNRLVMDATR